ncbi:MAG: hypothetical protein K2Q23_10835, partial [Bryobacteraceae bacterium]|nr:hypothetical protein [Bryobacteraceae bacterium]
MSSLREAAAVPWTDAHPFQANAATQAGQSDLLATRTIPATSGDVHAGPMPLSRVQERLVGFDLL